MLAMIVALCTSGAFAQTPSAVSFTPNGEFKWVVAEVETQRFADDANQSGPTLRANAQVQVIMTDGARARVKSGDKYGWVALTALTSEPPAVPTIPAGLQFDPALTAPMGGPPSLSSGMSGSGFRGDGGAKPK